MRKHLKEPTEDIQLQAANDEILHIYGTIDLDITLEDMTFKWNVFVADISDEGLLGFDFMHHFNFILEPRRGLRLNDRLFQCEIISDSSCNVIAKHDVIIPANSEFIIAGSANVTKLKGDLPYGLIEPMNSGETLQPIHVASCVVDINRNDIDLPVRVANTLGVDIHVHAGTKLANLQLIDKVYHEGSDGAKPLPRNINVVKSSSASGKS